MTRLCDETCSICHETMEEDSSGVESLFCGHKFHGKCILRWMQIGNASCPYCKQLHPDHKDFASSSRTQGADEGEFSDSASDEESPLQQALSLYQEMEVSCLDKASRDQDPAVKKMYASLEASKEATERSELSVSVHQAAFLEEKDGFLHRLDDEMNMIYSQKKKKGLRLLKQGKAHKDYILALRRNAYAKDRYRRKKRDIFKHYRETGWEAGVQA